MAAIKVLKEKISNRKPLVGDSMICINKKHFNYGRVIDVKSNLDVDFIDTTNWKVIEK